MCKFVETGKKKKKELAQLCTKFGRVQTAFAKGHHVSSIYCHSLKNSSTGDAGNSLNIHSDSQKAF